MESGKKNSSTSGPCSTTSNPCPAATLSVANDIIKQKRGKAEKVIWSTDLLPSVAVGHLDRRIKGDNHIDEVTDVTYNGMKNKTRGKKRNIQDTVDQIDKVFTAKDEECSVAILVNADDESTITTDDGVNNISKQLEQSNESSEESKTNENNRLNSNVDSNPNDTLILTKKMRKKLNAKKRAIEKSEIEEGNAKRSKINNQAETEQNKENAIVIASLDINSNSDNNDNNNIIRDKDKEKNNDQNNCNNTIKRTITTITTSSNSSEPNESIKAAIAAATLRLEAEVEVAMKIAETAAVAAAAEAAARITEAAMKSSTTTAAAAVVAAATKKRTTRSNTSQTPQINKNVKKKGENVQNNRKTVNSCQEVQETDVSTVRTDRGSNTVDGESLIFDTIECPTVIDSNKNNSNLMKSDLLKNILITPSVSISIRTTDSDNDSINKIENENITDALKVSPLPIITPSSSFSSSSSGSSSSSSSTVKSSLTLTPTTLTTAATSTSTPTPTSFVSDAVTAKANTDPTTIIQTKTKRTKATKIIPIPITIIKSISTPTSTQQVKVTPTIKNIKKLTKAAVTATEAATVVVGATEAGAEAVVSLEIETSNPEKNILSFLPSSSSSSSPSLSTLPQTPPQTLPLPSTQSSSTLSKSSRKKLNAKKKFELTLITNPIEAAKIIKEREEESFKAAKANYIKQKMAHNSQINRKNGSINSVLNLDPTVVGDTFRLKGQGKGEGNILKKCQGQGKGQGYNFNKLSSSSFTLNVGKYGPQLNNTNMNTSINNNYNNEKKKLTSFDKYTNHNQSYVQSSIPYISSDSKQYSNSSYNASSSTSTYNQYQPQSQSPYQSQLQSPNLIGTTQSYIAAGIQGASSLGFGEGSGLGLGTGTGTSPWTIQQHQTTNSYQNQNQNQDVDHTKEQSGHSTRQGLGQGNRYIPTQNQSYVHTTPQSQSYDSNISGYTNQNNGGGNSYNQYLSGVNSIQNTSYSSPTTYQNTNTNVNANINTNTAYSSTQQNQQYAVPYSQIISQYNTSNTASLSQQQQQQQSYGQQSLQTINDYQYSKSVPTLQGQTTSLLAQVSTAPQSMYGQGQAYTSVAPYKNTSFVPSVYQSNPSSTSLYANATTTSTPSLSSSSSHYQSNLMPSSVYQSTPSSTSLYSLNKLNSLASYSSYNSNNK